MNRTQHRFLSIFATGVATLALGAAPALAGSEGCGGADCQDENSPATVVPVAPTPVAPLQSPLIRSGDTAPERSSNAPHSHTASPVRHVVRGTRTRHFGVAQRTLPRGAVAARAGGTAQQGPESMLVGLAGAALVLLAAGGGLVASGRRAGS
jgi:hypothetical protein